MIRLKTLKIHKAIIWDISWSCYGDFLISCGIEGVMFLWGPNSSFFSLSSKKKFIIEKKTFESWDCLGYFKLSFDLKTFRNTHWSNEFNQICIGTFLGKTLICEIFFRKTLDVVFFKKISKLEGHISEIKKSQFSKDGSLISTCSRDKIIWIWEKNFKDNFQCLFVIGEHESDIKYTNWNPRFDILISSTYEGKIRCFIKKNQEFDLLYFLKLSNFTVWAIEFNENGNNIFFLSGKGEIFFYPLSIRILKKKKIWKKNEKFFFFILTRKPLFSLAYSNANSLFSMIGDDENLNILKNSKIWSWKKDPTFFFGGIKKNLWISLENSLARSHCSSGTKILWHPRNENIIASCGEDSSIHIWSLHCKF